MRDINQFAKTLSKVPPDGCPFKVGDKVKWVNDYGVAWEHEIIGFDTESWYNKEYKCYVHLNSDAYWFPHDHTKLELITQQLYQLT